MSEARTSPHNLEAERSVLGAILINNGVYPLAAAVVSPGDFYRAAHGHVFECVGGLLARNVVADLVTVKESLERNGLLDEVGGPAYLASLVDGVPHSTNAEFYAAIVKEKQRLRHLNKVLGTAASDALAGEYSAAEIVGRLDSFVQGTQVANSAELLTVIDEADLGSIAQAPALVAGYFSNGVNVVAAAPGVGKTTLCYAVGVRAAAGLAWQGLSTNNPGAVIIIAAEGASAADARLRAAKIGAGLDPGKPIGIKVIPHAVNFFQKGPAYLALRRLVSELGARLVVPDTFGLNIAGADENSAVETTIALAAMRELGCAVIVPHHLDKANKAERGSSAIRANADALLTLIETDEILTLSVEKMRDGVPGPPMQFKLVEMAGTGACTIVPAKDVLATADLSHAQQAALDALWQTFGTSSATRAEWLALVPTIKERTGYHAISRLVALGFVSESKGRFAAVRRGELQGVARPEQRLRTAPQSAAQSDCNEFSGQFLDLQSAANHLRTKLQTRSDGSLDPIGTLQGAEHVRV